MPATKIDPLIQHLLEKDPKLWEALKRLEQQDRMTWLISFSDELANGQFSVPAIVNEDVLFVRMLAVARVAPTTAQCTIQVWHNDGVGAYKYANILALGIDAVRSNIIIPQTGGVRLPKNPKINDYFYAEVIEAGGAADVTISIECKREIGRLAS